MRFPAAFVLLMTLLSTTVCASAEQPSAPADAAVPPASSEATAQDDSDTDIPEAAGPGVYLVARMKLTDTDLTQVVFYRHSTISTLEACEVERTAGLTTGWNHYRRYYLKTNKAMAYQVDYRCVQSEARITPWRRGMRMDHSYLVRTRDQQLQVSSHSNFFACRKALRALSREESMDTFCAISSQSTEKAPAAATAASETATPP